MEPYAQTYLAMIALREGDAESAMTLAQAALETSLAVQNVETQITALFQIAEIERSRGRTDAAAAAFERAHAIAVANDEPLRFDAAAGIARVALARGDGAARCGRWKRCWPTLPKAVRWTAPSRGTHPPDLLRGAVGHRRSACRGMLDTAHAMLQKQADALADTGLRENFLNNVPEHREIAAA